MSEQQGRLDLALVVVARGDPGGAPGIDAAHAGGAAVLAGARLPHDAARRRGKRRVESAQRVAVTAPGAR